MYISKYCSNKLDPIILSKMIYLDKEFPYGAWTNDVWKFISEQFLFNSDNYILFIAQEPNLFEIVGYCLLRKDPESFHIMKVVVDSNYQSKGIGTKFMDACIYYPNPDILPITLEVKEDNTKAISLYKKFGFNVIELLPEYYDDKSNAFKMLRIVK